MSKNKGKVTGQKIIIKKPKKSMDFIFKRDYPTKCKYCPKILHSPQQEDIHFRRVHIGK
ncbi:MAG: hypothetical protein WC711_04090 [Candidatus Staskawiczbacteria bacterium]|jgi:hypothetical protein